MPENSMDRGRGRLAVMAAVATLVAAGASYAGGALIDCSDASAQASATARSAASGSSDLVSVDLGAVDPSKVQLAFDDFPTTRDGLAYGSDANAETFDEAPDLIAVAMDDGGLGFVRNTELYRSPASPEEAIAHQNGVERNGGVETIPAYDLAGKLIGTSSTVPSRVLYEPPRH